MHMNRIRIRGCRQNNLKNICLEIPKGRLTVITGVSGSGKSSLAFETIYAEGQRRYMECLSPQVRSWMRQVPKPDVDFIDGLSPTLAIGNKLGRINFSSSVAMQTDIYDFLCVLYAKIGEQYSPQTGKRLLRQTRQQIEESILKDYDLGKRLQIVSPIVLDREGLLPTLERLRQQGFLRVRINEQEHFLEDTLFSVDEFLKDRCSLEVIVDRIVMKEDIRSRISESLSIALDLGRGVVKVIEGRIGKERYFTEIYVCPETGFSFSPLGISDFNFQSIHGACPSCKGKGGSEKVQVQYLLDRDKSFEGQLLDWIEKIPKKKFHFYERIWKSHLENHMKGKKDEDLLDEILYGSDKSFVLEVEIDNEVRSLEVHWKGLVAMIQEDLDEKRSKSRFSGLDCVLWEDCRDCNGSRLKIESRFCRVEGKAIHEVCSLTVGQALKVIKSWRLEGNRLKISEELLSEVLSRLSFLEQVGLGYLELNRQGNTLSEGEIQRVQLAAHVGAKLSGVLYVFDEPSNGLHHNDTQQLMKIIKKLRDLGNTVLLVEHERGLISCADYVVELGEGAGNHGGRVIFQGTYKEMLDSTSSLTGRWFRGEKMMPLNKKRGSFSKKLKVRSLSCHNLKKLNVDIPLEALVGICGVSGSGKSSLVIHGIAHEIRRQLIEKKRSKIVNGGQLFHRLVVVKQRQAGISPRSIPATFVGIMTALRQLFSSTKLAKARGYTLSHFSLNKRGGRCDACEGMGKVRIAMSFMADIFVTCDVCMGKRYNFETLQIFWDGVSIADVLEMSVEEASLLFKQIPEIFDKLSLMEELGLGYLILGQSFESLSSGEIQRLKLVSELALRVYEPTLYILDEPSVGLHCNDIEKLVKILHRLVDRGHTVLVIEHNLDILRGADWLIELGPSGGEGGGRVIFEGRVESLIGKKTATGQALDL